MHGILICRINICLSCGQRYLDLVLVLPFTCADNIQTSIDLVVALRSSRHIMHNGKLVQVSSVAHKENEKGTYRVDLQHGDVRGHHEQILDEMSNRIPWLELK